MSGATIAAGRQLLRKRPGSSVQLVRTYGVIGALVVLVMAVSVASPTFLSSTNLLNLASQWAPAGIMAVAATYVILTGGLDLSVAATFSFSAVMAAYVGQTQSVVVAFAVAIALATVIGIANGVLVSGIGVNPFIATLGMAFVVGGITLVVTGNKFYTVEGEAFSMLGQGKLFGVPYAAVLLVGTFLVGGIALARTVFGQAIYAIGGNPEASRLSGIRVRVITGSTYALSGLAAGIGGVLAASRLNSGQANMDPNIVFDVITIVVVGGNSLVGGFGAIWRTAIGLAILATIANGFNLIGLDPVYQDIVKGAIIIGALALDAYGRRLASRGGG